MLVVEADAGMAFLMREVLVEAGFEAVLSTPEKAPALAAEQGFSGVLASLTTAAYEQAPLYKALKGDPRTRELPLILCTGRGEYTVKRRLGERPPHVLFKPFTVDQLTAAVKDAFAS